LPISTRFAFRPGLARRWEILSHGERKRAQVGAALFLDPAVLGMDEPTNHLDLPAVECLEEALEGCPAALLMVSHDVRFLDRLATRR
jgi:ATPase subunit of ABC transporter with duplicated ATPase domains